MAVEWPATWGLVRRMSYAGEPWHVVEVSAHFDWRHGETNRPARCGAVSWLGRWWGVAAYTGHERVCERCLRACAELAEAEGAGDGR